MTKNNERGWKVMVVLFVLVGLIVLLTGMQKHRLAMALFILNVFLTLAVFWHHVTDKIPVNF